MKGVDEKFIKECWESFTVPGRTDSEDLGKLMGENNGYLAKKLIEYEPEQAIAAKYILELYAYKASKERADASEAQWRWAVFFSLAASAGVFLVEFIGILGWHVWVESFSLFGFVISVFLGLAILLFHRIKDSLCGKPEGL
jgi:hypothetical protein